jgi:hypothetical protein
MDFVVVATEHMKKHAEETINIPAGQWLWVYRGPIMNPATELEQQVPVGKVWNVAISITIEETDAA